MASDTSAFGQEVTAAVGARDLTRQGEQPADRQAAFTADEQERLRAELLKANPRTVPELIQGRTMTEMIDSVRTAEAAYHRVQAAIEAATPTTAGGGVRSETVAAPGGLIGQRGGRMQPLTLIALGLAANDRAGTIEAHGLGRVNIVGNR